ncbi:MAG TPA: VanW family protein [Anaerolineaceae bacterium]|nr:VanW family protein [Anaerolineaceae bacterium]
MTEDTTQIPITPAPAIPAKRANMNKQIGFVLIFGILLALATLFAIVFGFEAKHENAIFPGVSVNGTDLSGLTVGQAVVKINGSLTYPKQGQIFFTDGDSRWAFNPNQLGYTFEPISAVEQAYQVGRGQGLLADLSSQFFAMKSGVNIDPSVVYDHRSAHAMLQEIARQIDKPMIEAAITLDGTEVKVSEGQIGRRVDIPATLKKLEPFFLTQISGTIPLVIEETAPVIMDVKATADLARSILSQDFTIQPADPNAGAGPWVIKAQDLASLLQLERISDAGTAGYQLSLNRQSLLNYLSSIAPSLRVEPVNARMYFNDERSEIEVIQNAVIGKGLDLEQSVDQIIQQLQAGQHQATLVMQDVEPAVRDDSTAASLGITELVYEGNSYFYGSSADRLQNIRTAAASFHGVMVAPGEVFSMAKYLTDISLENGYAEAIIIVGDQSVRGVGGGVCQVSTTLFRTAFFAGFPIVERYPHAYRVSYYEQNANGWVDTNLAGLDATVYVPMVDFKFRNDTPYWILMETYTTNYSLTWKFYSTSDGRSVDWNTTGVTNVTPPPEPVYREDPTLPKDTIKQVDWAVNGASVSVQRTVYKDGSVYFTDYIHTTYVPWPDGYNYGPGTDIGEHGD